MNKALLVGRITNDIELKKTPTGLSIVSFTIAINRRVSKDQEKQTDFINCVAWRQAADFLAQYAEKGNRVSVDGRIQTRNYEANDGRKVYVTEIVCDNVELLESKSNKSELNNNEKNYLDQIDITLDDDTLPF